jgi:hypothetical protein
MRTSISRTRLCSKSRNGMFRRPVSLVVADMGLGGCALTPAALEDLDVGSVGRSGRLGSDGRHGGEGQMRAGVRAFAPDDHPGSGRPLRQIQGTGDSAIWPFPRSLPSVSSAETHASSGILRIVALTWSISSQPTELAQPVLTTEVQQLMCRTAESARTRISMFSMCAAGTCASASSTTAMWSAALLEPAFLGRKIAASA